MVRVVKKPAVRQAEILEVARQLFQAKGYEATSVDEIVRTADIAKGTFYYYFKSKEDVLNLLAHRLVADVVTLTQRIADDPNMGAIDKFCAILNKQSQILQTEQGVIEDMHRPQNRALHERNNREIILMFGPVLASVIEQGNREGVFHVEDALSTIQFILAGSLFLFGEGIFQWTAEEEAARTQAMLILIERAVGAAENSFALALSNVSTLSSALAGGKS